MHVLNIQWQKRKEKFCKHFSYIDEHVGFKCLFWHESPLLSSEHHKSSTNYRDSSHLRPVARLANHALKITLWVHIRLGGWIINSGPRKSSWLFINNCACGRSLSEQNDLTPLRPSQTLLNTKANCAASQEIEMTGSKNSSSRVSSALVTEFAWKHFQTNSTVAKQTSFSTVHLTQ